MRWEVDLDAYNVDFTFTVTVTYEWPSESYSSNRIFALIKLSHMMTVPLKMLQTLLMKVSSSFIAFYRTATRWVWHHWLYRCHVSSDCWVTLRDGWRCSPADVCPVHLSWKHRNVIMKEIKGEASDFLKGRGKILIDYRSLSFLLEVHLVLFIQNWKHKQASVFF